LKSAFDSAVTNSTGGDSSTLVILDSLNYIKGYRYELYCISKAAGERHGVVWIQGSKTDEERRLGTSTSDSLAKKWNHERLHATEEGGDYYQEQIMDELVARYEPPDERNRWENPLYKVDVSVLVPWDINGTLNQTKSDASSEVTQQMQEVKLDKEPTKVVKSASGFKRNKKVKLKTTESSALSQSTVLAAAVETPSVVPSGPISMAARNLSTNTSTSASSATTQNTIEDTINSILSSFLSIQPLKEGMSTANHASAESDVLNVVDSVTQRVNVDILRVQKLKSGTGCDRITICIGAKDITIKVGKQLKNTELRDMRTQFLKWTATHPGGSKEEEIMENYAKYIETVVGKDS
jgi:tRNA uridine 5-carbamoylmethylation protein Kti12